MRRPPPRLGERGADGADRGSSDPPPEPGDRGVVMVRRLLLVAAILLTGCSASTTVIARPPGPARTPCGKVTIAVNPWVGYAADVAVASYLLRHELGCQVVRNDLT